MLQLFFVLHIGYCNIARVFVPHLLLFRCLGKAVLCDCGFPRAHDLSCRILTKLLEQSRRHSMKGV